MKLNRLLSIATICFAFFVFTSCTKGKLISIEHNNASIHYMGRILNSDSMKVFSWSGTSAQINFEGTAVSAIMQDESGDNYYNVIIDNDSIIVIRPGKNKETIQLVAGLAEGRHSLELFKRTEYNRGSSYFFGFEIEGKVLTATPERKQKIEFYGNSITAGYAIEDFSSNDSPDSTFTNNYLTYAALTARHFDAEYHCICKSGIGITISWFPNIMPDVYDLTNANDNTHKWDFAKYTPDIVVINLFQNDSWLVNLPNHDSFKKYFGTEKPSEEFIIEAYRDFVSKIRGHYPHSSIICSLGSMDATQEGSKWPGYVEEAVAKLNDDRIYTYFMPYKNSPGHPTIEENEVMAAGLIDFIEQNIEW